MLVTDPKTGKKKYAELSDPTLAQQFFTGVPDLGHLPPEKEVQVGQDDWRSGFGQEYFDSGDLKRYYKSIKADARFKNRVMAGPLPTAVTLPTSTAPSITNADFETWPNGTPTGWTLEAGSCAKESTIKHGDSYSVKTTAAGTKLYQDLSTTQIKGRRFIFTGWAYTTNNDTARIGIDDEVSTVWSPYHTGAAGWEQLSVTVTLSQDATRLRLYLHQSSATDSYFDDFAITRATLTSPKCFAEFNSELYMGMGGLLTKLNATGTTYTGVYEFANNISALEPFVDDYLYIALGGNTGTVVEDCEDTWSDPGANVAVTLDTTDYKVGSGSVKMAVEAGLAAGAIMGYEDITLVDLKDYTGILCWIKSSVATNAGDIEFLIDDTAACASPVESLDVPALTADKWTRVWLPFTTPANMGAIISVGLEMHTDLGEFDCWIDDVRVYSNYAYMSVGESITHSTLADGMADYFQTVNITLWKAILPREMKSATDPTNAGSWSTATNIDSTAYNITCLIEKAGSIYIMKEDQPFYLDSDGNVQRLIPSLKPETATTSGKNSCVWKDKIYIPCGTQALIEYDAGTVTNLSPATFTTNDDDFDGRVMATAFDAEYLFVAVDNATKIELVAGRWETINSTVQWVWHPIGELTLDGAETIFASTIYKRRLYIASTSSSDSLYYYPLPSGYGNIAGDVDYDFLSEGYLITGWHHCNFKADKKAWIKLTLTMSDTTSTIYWEAHYQKLGDSSWTDIGDFKTSPTTTRFIPVDGSANKPSSTMMRFKFVPIISDTEETLRPNAAGDETNIEAQFPDSTYHWDKVDEAVADDDTTWVRSNEVAYERDLYNIPDHSVGRGTISKITVYARCYASGTPSQASLKIAIKSGTGSGAPDTADESAEETLAASLTWENFSNEWATNPATSAAWTWDEIDKLQIGIAIRQSNTSPAHYTRCTQVYVVVDYSSKTPILKTYDVRGIWYPTIRKMIVCQVRCADNLPTKDGSEQDETASSIRLGLDETLNPTTAWPIAFYPPYWASSSDTKYIKVIHPFSQEIATQQVGENTEYIYNLMLEEVALS